MSRSTAQLRRRGRAGAFTLMEMVVSCIIIAMLMLSLGYGLKLALVSTGNGAAQSVASLDGADIVERIADDLNEATNFTEKTATSVTFTVPDRGTDGNPDIINYKWWPTAGNIVIPGTPSGGGGSSGGSGGGGGLLGGLLGGLGGLLGGGGSSGGSSGGSGGTPDTLIPVPAFVLTRQIGSDPANTSIVARDVRNFDLRYHYRSMPANTAGVTTNNDRLLVEYNPGSLVGIAANYDLNTNRAMGITFLPSSVLPNGTTSLNITRVQVQLKTDANCDGMMIATLRKVSTNVLQPNWPLSGAANILDTSTGVAEVQLSDTFGWAEFKFTTTTVLNPATKYSIVIQGLSGTSPMGNISYVTGGLPLPSGAVWVQSTNLANASPTWSTSSLNSIRVRIYGNYLP